MKTRFWELTKPNTSRYRAEWAHDEMRLGEGGGKRLTDLSIVLPGDSIQDFVWTWYSECCVQQHVLEMFRNEGFTGFEIKPVRARYEKSSSPPPPLWELVITGWGGMAAEESGIKLNEEESCLARHYYRYTGTDHPERIIDVSRWDGSDFFMVWPLPRFVFITDRVAHLIKEKKLIGARIVTPADLKKSDGFTPGRLSYYMPDMRAKELGEPLGIY